MEVIDVAESMPDGYYAEIDFDNGESLVIESKKFIAILKYYGVKL